MSHICRKACKNFYSDTQWPTYLIKKYLSATDEEGKREAVSEMFTYVKGTDSHVAYALTPREITKIREVETLKVGFHLNAVYSQVSLTLKNNAYGLKVYVMDENGNVTTHYTTVGGITLKTGAVAYGTFNFKTAAWDVALPETGYFVGYKVYPYAGLDKNVFEDVTLTATVTADKLSSAERLRFVMTPSTYTVGIPKADTPKGITVDGATFNGLNERIVYSVAPYTINGADNSKSIEVTGVTSYTLPEGFVGAYGIYVKGNDIDLLNSDAFITYVRGSYTARLDLHDKKSSGLYKVSGTRTPGSFSYTVNDWAPHDTFNGGISTLGDHISAAQAKALYTAFTATDATDETKKAAFATMLKSSNISNKYLQYNMASDEIIPVSEINKYEYKVDLQRGGFTYKNQISEFVVLVMDSTGAVTGYTYQHAAKNLSTTEVTKTVDFKNKESSYGKWIDELPTKGYVVGFQYKIYANLDNYANVSISSSSTGTRYMIYPTTSYVIDIPVLDAPKGIKVEGTSFKGLDASKTYAIAPYTINGIDKTLEETVTGVTEYDVASGFENAKGTYAIYFKGDDLNHSASAASNVVYVQGTLAEKRDIIFTNGQYNVYPANWSLIGDWSTGNVSAPLSNDSSNGGKFGVPLLKSTIMSTWFFPGTTNTDTNKANLPKIRYSYAYNPDEIPTVNELSNIKFKIQRQNSSLVAKAKAKVNFVVLSSEGVLSNYTVITNEYTFNSNTTTFTIDFQSIADLPENGYVLGFEVFPLGELITMTPENTSFSNLGIYFYFTSTAILETPAEAPRGIKTEGTTFKGLDASKTYVVAAYTVVGATKGAEKTVTGVTSINIATLYDELVGLYGIYYDATDYNSASEPGAVIYVSGSREDKKALGTLKTYTHTYQGSSFDYTVPDFEDVTEAAKEWEVGKIIGGDYFVYIGKDYNSYKADWLYSPPSSKALYEAEQKNDGSYETLQKKAESILEGGSFRYAYNPEEIIPIDEVVEMQFTVALGTSYISVINPRTKYVLYVMNTDGSITEHIYLTPYRDITGDISATSENMQSIVPRRDFNDLPAEGWIIGYKVYPYGELASKNITYRQANIANSSSEYSFYFRTPLSIFPGSYVIAEKKADIGMSLLLDGKIGIKVTAGDTLSNLSVSNVVGTDNYVDFGSKQYAVFYFDPKDVADATVSFVLTYTDAEGTATGSYTLAVANYIDALKESDDANVVNIANAFENYFNAASDYLNGTSKVEAIADLTADELADLEEKSNYTRNGAVAGLEFHSTSLILEEDTTIRHYFKITDDSVKTDADLAKYTVAGATALKLSTKKNGSGDRFAYVDVVDVSSNQLSEVKTVTVTDGNGTVTVNFNALAYADLCLEQDDAKLLNVAKALYRYSVASDEYCNVGRDNNESDTSIW